MADAMKIVRSTQPQWNNIKAAGDHYARTRRLGEGIEREAVHLPTDLVKVRNDSGADRAAGDVLELTDFILDDVTQEYLWFAGEEPAIGGVRFGVLRRALPEDEIGEMHLSGVCVAKVDVGNVNHPRARVVPGSHVLVSGYGGPFKLLYSPDTGEQLCPVAFAQGNGNYVAKTDGSGITAISGDTPGSGTVTLYAYDGADLVSLSVTETCRNMAGAVAADTYIQTKVDEFGVRWVDVEAC